MLSDEKLTLRIHVSRHEGQGERHDWTVSREECGSNGEARSVHVVARVGDESAAQELAREIGRKQGLPVYCSQKGALELIQLPNAACA